MPSKYSLVNVDGAGSPMLLADRVEEVSPAIVILSHLPPEALAQARYQVRRLRSRFSGDGDCHVVGSGAGRGW